MAFDSDTRKRLSRFVGEARALIATEFSEQFSSLYGVDSGGACAPLEKLGHLNDEGLATAKRIRERLDYLIRSHPDDRGGAQAAVNRLAREQAFTVLNRLVAVRMAEKRGLIVEAVAKGYASQGFKVFGQVAGAGLGETFDRYRRFLFCLFDELAVDLGVLFTRRSPQSLLFPREKALLELIALLKDAELEPLWAEDETIGWIYQYYNDEAERKKMREESAVPRNSRELAVRNQFFTPRYVVEFLTDNTLGRLWYEMRQGQTALKDQCRYLVRRPNEIFPKPGATAPDTPKAGEYLSQEELLRQPVHIPHRPLKDPREIRLLDPACGSMHFGLYAFDLFTVIYDEAWEIAHSTDAAAKSAETFARFVTFAGSFPDKTAFLREVPCLIVEHNIHGIDIDPRAAQIAGLSLWLRAQRAWHQVGVKPVDRPRITRSNLVCAEPMPGDEGRLKEFCDSVKQPAIGRMVEVIFEKLKLAGEAGSLLRIEEEIRELVHSTKLRWAETYRFDQNASELFSKAEIVSFSRQKKSTQPELDIDFAGIADESFWDKAEQRIYDALEAYAEQAENGGGFQRRLFADDAAQGFAFIDLCRKRYDVAVMNPPFGKPAAKSLSYLKAAFPDDWKDIYAAFFARMRGLVTFDGSIGAITSLLYLYSKQLRALRGDIVQRRQLQILVELGGGVLDGATVETALSILTGRANPQTGYLDLFSDPAKDTRLIEACRDRRFIYRYLGEFEHIFGWPLCLHMPGSELMLWVAKQRFEPDLADVVAGNHTFDDFRFLRLRYEVAPTNLNERWFGYEKGGEYQPFLSPTILLFNWFNDGSEARSYQITEYGTDAQTIQSISKWFQPGLTFPRVNLAFSPKVLSRGCIFSEKGMSVFLKDQRYAYPILGLLSSSWSEELLCAFGRHRAYENSAVANLPYGESLLLKIGDNLGALTKNCVDAMLEQESYLETSPYFVRSKWTRADTERWRMLSDIIPEKCDQIDRLVGSGLFGSDEHGLSGDTTSVLIRRHVLSAESPQEERVGAMQWVLGTVFGRWDIRYATGERPAPQLLDPFAPLPVCPPGMLQGDDGLPLSPEAGRRLRTEGRYPLDVAWDGILVDDPEHPLDLERRVQAVLAVLWADRTEALEHEACALLGVPTLREWFRKPAGFFADHLKRYSKSRRQAPIYWPLSTASGSYTLWIYYHRLTDQTLHKALADFVDPKIRAVEAEVSALRTSPKNASKLAERVEFLDELKDFRGEIDRIIRLHWTPNLDDGVLITAAPLWKLFRLPKWQKDLKACWSELEAGDYDWAHLAHSISPKRVEEKCRTDRSLAIAHGLERYCEVKAAEKKARKIRAKKSQMEMEEQP